jgi:hypothetical protein
MWGCDGTCRACTAKRRPAPRLAGYAPALALVLAALLVCVLAALIGPGPGQ